MNRTLFAATAAVLGGALVMAARSAATAETKEAAAPAQTKKAAAMPNPFYAMDTYTKDLDLVKELGYAGLSWTLGDPKASQAAAEKARERGLKIFAIYCGVTLGKDKLQYDPRLKDTLAALKGHDTLIWLHISSKDYPKSSADGDAAAMEGLREIADLAAAQGLRVAIYPHVGNWTERVQDAVRVARKVDRKNFGVTFNLCHCLAVGDEDKIPALLEEAAPHLFMVSINGADSKAPGGGWGRLIQTLDRGTFDMVPLLKKLRAINYQGPIGLQGFGVKGDAKDNLARSMAAWRQLSAQAMQ
jgi:sugar phosphate isomerase/epimerase